MDRPAADLQIARAVQTVLGASAAADVPWCPHMLARAGARGYFTPDEDEEIKLRYAQYLGVRAALLGVLAAMEKESGSGSRDWAGRVGPFAAAFPAACLLVRGSHRLAAEAGFQFEYPSWPEAARDLVGRWRERKV